MGVVNACVGGFAALLPLLLTYIQGCQPQPGGHLVSTCCCVVGHRCALLSHIAYSFSFPGCKPFVSPQFSALDVLAGMMMKGAAKCDKHAE